MNKVKAPLALLRFRRPRLAIIACGISVFTLAMLLAPVDKFAFEIALGFGIGFLTYGARAMRSQVSNLGVLLALLGLAQIAAGVLVTAISSPEALVGSTLDAVSASVIGGGLGFFASIDEE